ncbi:hypothetical protein L4690_006311 [Pseudomonas aeruginosa]|uniref:DUF1281 family ferredoxin-like fold protein n=2 Tax=Pseudomonas aeruginosa TaxID=287 RepID=UPI00053E1D95|nr:hypothetical protein [Pseudomonas aeruginosa]AWE68990.1 hypothetical protein CSC32_4005 [Pseudomonas aeruginosa]EIU1659551.1 hypothetical protein [Pseudomonas aeruginosa]EKJ8513840.1 hypothetical protein [Pseudomonas aeruginosa]EKM6335127.1 hypothetical protein [Pseudomonas aeruginosa]EKU7422939.1 hypothetical protein [Pseudomonas aeruginosa]
MPNWVTNKVKAPQEVIQAMVSEEGRIDFGKIIKFGGEFPWDGVSVDAETAAERVLNLPLNSHPLVGSMQKSSRDRVDVSKLSDESFEQFIQMLRNHRQTGYLHDMDFARSAWGTKWNAYESRVDGPESASFETAWSFPEPIFLKLSSMFPEATIELNYADEDIGSNCGTVRFKGGEAIYRDESAGWNSMSGADRERWTSFAYEVKGWERDQEDD